MEPIGSWLRERASGRVGPKADRIVDLMIASPKFASYASAAALGQRAGVDASTVVRTAHSLGFEGWPDLQNELRSRFLSSLNASQLLQVHDDGSADPIVRALRSDLDLMAQNVNAMDIAHVRALASALVSARRVVVLAVGSYAAPALQLVHVAARLGVDIQLADRGGHTLVTSLAALTSDDVLLVVNLWQTTREVLAATTLAAERGITVCSITDVGATRLSEMSDINVGVATEGTSHFPSMAPALSLVHALLAELTSQLGPEVRARIEHHDATQRTMERLRKEVTPNRSTPAT